MAIIVGPGSSLVRRSVNLRRPDQANQNSSPAGEKVFGRASDLGIADLTHELLMLPSEFRSQGVDGKSVGVTQNLIFIAQLEAFHQPVLARIVEDIKSTVHVIPRVHRFREGAGQHQRPGPPIDIASHVGILNQG